ncbi:MAG: hypothetical protein HGA65_00045 [Oscillochloris sp.]|nr:hypothetical protein [Oscillochloris sp.]
MKTHRIGVRVSAELHALLAVAGDVSAATRALSLLGAQAAGYEIGLLRDEAAGLLAAQLDPPVRAALWAMLRDSSTPVLPMLDSRGTRVEPLWNPPPEPALGDALPDDPLATIGFEV